ncbi:uncharacterized protein PV09_04587 [Verruconis gallopava]|uniref:Uncharacterized protein n=1 Tax=Verruconis gallopava TaxID=253628 RepID=A0A0D1XNY7_9PEZI|nr:uncharacterized protein PV09_04587 [Verruconis gallopava]KIW04291.1 hypothetical protein PV09_04587 [Verruconis gallopava]
MNPQIVPTPVSATKNSPRYSGQRRRANQPAFAPTAQKILEDAMRMPYPTRIQPTPPGWPHRKDPFTLNKEEAKHLADDHTPNGHCLWLNNIDDNMHRRVMEKNESRPKRGPQTMLETPNGQTPMGRVEDGNIEAQIQRVCRLDRALRSLTKQSQSQKEYSEQVQMMKTDISHDCALPAKPIIEETTNDLNTLVEATRLRAADLARGLVKASGMESYRANTPVKAKTKDTSPAAQETVLSREIYENSEHGKNRFKLSLIPPPLTRHDPPLRDFAREKRWAELEDDQIADLKRSDRGKFVEDSTQREKRVEVDDEFVTKMRDAKVGMRKEIDDHL